MSAIEAIKKGFAVANSNLILAVFLFVFSLVGRFVSSKFAGMEDISVLIQSTGILYIAIIMILGHFFIQAGNLGIIRDYLKEGKIRLINFPRYGIKYFLRIFGLGIAIIVIAVLIFFIGNLIAIPIGLFNIIAGSIISLVLEGIGLYWVLLLAALSPYGIVCGDLSLIEAMAASVDITRRYINKVALLFLIIGLFGLAWGIIMTLVPKNPHIIISIIGAAFNGYFGVMMPASLMSLYLSLTAE